MVVILPLTTTGSLGERRLVGSGRLKSSLSQPVTCLNPAGQRTSFMYVNSSPDFSLRNPESKLYLHRSFNSVVGSLSQS
jgi:hypothetical protein